MVALKRFVLKQNIQRAYGYIVHDYIKECSRPCIWRVGLCLCVNGIDLKRFNEFVVNARTVMTAINQISKGDPHDPQNTF